MVSGSYLAVRRLQTAMKIEAQLRRVIRLKHYSRRTEESYVQWYLRYVHLRHHSGRHRQNSDLSYIEAQLRNSPVNERYRPAFDTGGSGAQRYPHHGNLYRCGGEPAIRGEITSPLDDL